MAVRFELQDRTYILVRAKARHASNIRSTPDGNTKQEPRKQGRQDSNLQPPVLETGALAKLSYSPVAPRSLDPVAVLRGAHVYTITVVRSHTVYRTFNTSQRRAFVRITEDVAQAVRDAGIAEGMAIVCAMHITAAVWINDDEPGLQADVLEWLDKVAPPSWHEPDGEVARELLPNPGDYRHHRGGEDNGDAHLKNLLVHHQVIVPVTDGELDLGPWQQIFYCEFDGRRPKRLVIKVLGE